MDPLREWRMRHQELQRLLRTRSRFEEAIQLYLSQHRVTHAGEMSSAAEWSLEDIAVDGLSDEQMRYALSIKEGANSIAWILWHIARTEDVTMNLFVAGHAQVLEEDNWAERMGLSQRDTGTGMSDDDVSSLSQRLDIPSIRLYRQAVGRKTEEIVMGLRWEDLGKGINHTQIERLWQERALDERARRLADFWSTRSTRFFITMPAMRHAFLHLCEALKLRERLPPNPR